MFPTAILEHFHLPQKFLKNLNNVEENIPNERSQNWVIGVGAVAVGGKAAICGAGIPWGHQLTSGCFISKPSSWLMHLGKQ